jgi:hypothetical protein
MVLYVPSCVGSELGVSLVGMGGLDAPRTKSISMTVLKAFSDRPMIGARL